MGLMGHGGSGLGEAEENQWGLDGEQSGATGSNPEVNAGDADVRNLPPYTKHSSGVRFKSVLEEAQKQLQQQLQQQSDLDSGYNNVIASPGQLQSIVEEVDGLGEVTVPDIRVLDDWQKEQPRPDRALLEMEKLLTEAFRSRVDREMSWVAELVGQNDQLYGEKNSGEAVLPEQAVGEEIQEADFDTTTFISEEEAQQNLESLRKWRSSLRPMRRAVHLVEKHFGYECPWWDSPNALVRVWGQLDCALQIFSDERLVRDLVEVLGKEVVIADTHPREGRLYGFAYLTENAGRLRALIRQKYAGHKALLDAIIRKQNNNE
jgi:hypothetical protein